jgi:hypothetical protein
VTRHADVNSGYKNQKKRGIVLVSSRVLRGREESRGYCTRHSEDYLPPHIPCFNNVLFKPLPGGVKVLLFSLFMR